MFSTTLPHGWDNPLEILRRKWIQIPSGNDLRQQSSYLLGQPDSVLLDTWERARRHDCEDEGFGIRGWYHESYRGFVRDKKVLDIGCGMAISTLTFAEFGAKLTFVDIVAENVELVRRLCRIKNINAEFLYMEQLHDLDKLAEDYDVVTAIGSLINAPLAFTKLEVDRLKQHLRPGGRWLHFAYPRSRWVREGQRDYAHWGEFTDGPGTPWMEYHDLSKIKWLFEPSEIRILFECEWHYGDFNWFDIELVRV